MRKKNRSLLDKISGEPCVVCGARPPNDAHHLKSRGSGGTDSDVNCISLCRRCHSEFHQIGSLTFYNKHPRFQVHIEKMGWEVLNGKLFNPALVDDDNK